MAASFSIPLLSPAVVFVNPNAGRHRAAAAVPQIREIFESHSLPAEFVPTPSAVEMESSVRTAIARGARTLFAVGGDGTLQSLVNAAFGADVLLGILPAGGGNDFAAALQIPPDPVEAARLLLHGRVLRADLARVRAANGCERLYVGGGGLGIDAEAARHAGATFRRLAGRWRYIASALRALCSHRPVELRAEFPQSDLAAIEMSVLLAGALNTPTYGAGMKLAPGARVDDGLLNFVFVEAMSRLAALALLPGLAKDGILRTDRVRRMRAKKIRLSTSQPCLFHGDGEIVGSTPVEIEVVPEAIRVLAPASR